MLRIVFGSAQEKRVTLEVMGDSVTEALSWLRDAPEGWLALRTKKGDDVLVNAANVLYVEATSKSKAKQGFGDASSGDISPVGHRET